MTEQQERAHVGAQPKKNFAVGSSRAFPRFPVSYGTLKIVRGPDWERLLSVQKLTACLFTFRMQQGIETVEFLHRYRQVYYLVVRKAKLFHPAEGQKRGRRYHRVSPWIHYHRAGAEDVQAAPAKEPGGDHQASPHAGPISLSHITVSLFGSNRLCFISRSG